MSQAAASKAGDGWSARVLLSKVGLDGHDRGVKVVSAILRDANMEVIFLGIHQTADAIVKAAIEENVDVIGVSSLGGSHLAHSRELIDLLRENDCGDLPVILGGTVPVEDIPALEKIGVRAVLRPGSTREEIVSVVRKLGREARAAH